MTNQTTLTPAEYRRTFDLFMAAALTGLNANNQIARCEIYSGTLRLDYFASTVTKQALRQAEQCMAARGYVRGEDAEPIANEPKGVLPRLIVESCREEDDPQHAKPRTKESLLKLAELIRTRANSPSGHQKTNPSSASTVHLAPTGGAGTSAHCEMSGLSDWKTARQR